MGIGRVYSELMEVLLKGETVDEEKKEERQELGFLDNKTRESYAAMAAGYEKGCYELLCEYHERIREYQFLDREFKSMERFVERIRQEEPDCWHYGNTIADKCAAMVNHFQRRRNEAMNTLAAFVEDTLIGLGGALLVAKTLRYGTHREKEGKADALIMILQEAKSTLLQDRRKGPSYFGDGQFEQKDWDFRRALNEKYALERKARNLEEALEKANSMLSGSGQEVVEIVHKEQKPQRILDDDIPF